MTTTAAASSVTASATAKQLVHRLYDDCLTPGRLELLPELVSEDYIDARGAHGVAAFRASITSLRAGFPDVRFTIEDLIAEGDRVVVRWSWRATHTGTFNGHPPTGKQVSNTGTVIYQLAGDKIVRGWLEADRLGVLQQIGAVPGTVSPSSSAAALPPRAVP